MTNLIKSDGNGGLTIQKGTFAVILTILSILWLVIGVAGNAAVTKADVIRHGEEIKDIDNRVDLNEDGIIAIKGDIKNIKDDVADIKSNINKLLER